MSIYIYYGRMDGSNSSKKMTLYGLKQYLSDSNMSEEFPWNKVTIAQASPHEKPFFKEYPKVFHNVSHSGDWWVCAYGSTENGLDLQKVAHANTRKIAVRFFHQDETSWLEGQEEEEFYRLWAYNESYVKWKGKGLTEGLSYFSVISKKKGEGLRDHWKLGVEDVCQQEIPFVEDGYYL
ncbi:MAG: 4'-phosphopantetheinyl transferase superfamily protein, partial [Eubacteriales bacterium]|nr:4'-phosphopantetheinyl transferase superfamily protein [Eubacteriales bacterium]